MPIDREIWIHCGMERTGSSTLQTEYLPRMAGVTVIPKSGSRVLLDYVSRLELWRGGDVEHEIARYLDESKPTIISLEGLLGGYVVQLERLAFMFPSAKILITLRNQYDRIFSQYWRSARSGRTTTLLPFHLYLRFFRRSLVANNCYAEIIQAAKRLFPCGVQVYFYEEYKSNFESLALAWVEEMGGALKEEIDKAIPRNQSGGSAHRFPLRPLIWLMRLSGLKKHGEQYISRLERSIAPIYGGSRKERQMIREQLSPYFDEDNRLLEDVLGRTLPCNYFPTDGG